MSHYVVRERGGKINGVVVHDVYRDDSVLPNGHNLAYSNAIDLVLKESDESDTVSEYYESSGWKTRIMTKSEYRKDCGR